jgi:diacylglycerol kinase family enzyme
MITIIINPHARQGKAAALKPLVEAFLLESRFEAAVMLCGTPESLASVFKELPRSSRVIGVGGDGTNHRLLPFLLAGQHEYGIVPYGSGDDVARAQGLYGMDWKDTLHHALTAPARAVDVGLVESAEGDKRYFLGCFLLGFDGLINNQTVNWKIKGAVPYFITLLKQLPALRGWLFEMRYTSSGVDTTVPVHRHILCSVLNTPTYGSGYPIAPMTRMGDGTLTLLHAPMVGRFKFLQLFFKMLGGKHVGAKECHFAEITQLQVSCDEILSLSADGEAMDWQTTAVTVSVQPKILMVVGR